MNEQKTLVEPETNLKLIKSSVDIVLGPNAIKEIMYNSDSDNRFETLNCFLFNCIEEYYLRVHGKD